MSGPEILTKQEALESVLRELCEAADATVRNKRGAMLLAADPARRASMEATHRTFQRWIPALKLAHRKLEAADAIVAKALRRSKPRILA